MNLTSHRINAYQPKIKNVNKIVLLNGASNKLITNTKRCIVNLYVKTYPLFLSTDSTDFKAYLYLVLGTAQLRKQMIH